MSRGTHREYDKHNHRWRVMRATIEGEDALKGHTGEFKQSEFIPKFVPHDKERYDALIARAVYYNYVGNTHEGLVGMVFRKPQTVALPPGLEYLKTNADGAGAGLEEVAQDVVSEVLAQGRFGLLVDPGEEVGSLPYAKRYYAEDIVDWATGVRNGVRILTKVVLREISKASERDYQYRVLALVDNVYQQWVEDEEEKQIEESITPTGRDKSSLDYIPFQFFGSKNNQPNVDKPPLLDIANINLGHWRNSADYEESLHFHGQGTLVISSEWNADQIEKANPNGIILGARGAVLIGPEGEATLLQLEAATAISEEMGKKVRQMVGIGAQFIDEHITQQTATGVVQNASQRASNLNRVVTNVVKGMLNVIGFCADIEKADTADIKYDLNRIFYDRALSAQEVSAIIMLRDVGDIAQSDSRHLLRYTGWLRGDRTDEEIDGEIEENGE